MRMPPWLSESISLRADEILQKFKTGEFPDKTFSKLYAKWLDIPTPPGIVLEIQHKKVTKCYHIVPEVEEFLASYDTYVLRYDFRADFKELDKWMEKKKIRPAPNRCSKEDVIKYMEMCVNAGSTFADHFFLIVTPSTPYYPFTVSTINEGQIYIEYSDHFEAINGLGNVKSCVFGGKNSVVNETGLSFECVMEIARVTREFTVLIGYNTICELFIVDGMPCLLSAQKRSDRKVWFSIPFAGDMKILSPGPIQGTVKWVDKTFISEIIKNSSQRGKKYVFVAERPYSEFSDILRFAEGFVFNEGSMLCHLAVLLREKEIPARIIPLSTMKYNEGENIVLK